MQNHSQDAKRNTNFKSRIQNIYILYCCFFWYKTTPELERAPRLRTCCPIPTSWPIWGLNIQNTTLSSVESGVALPLCLSVIDFCKTVFLWTIFKPVQYLNLKPIYWLQIRHNSNKFSVDRSLVGWVHLIRSAVSHRRYTIDGVPPWIAWYVNYY